MRKREELANTASCMNRAGEEEMVFVLLTRDACAPATVRFWAYQRVAAGKNKLEDEQIQEALVCADVMERERTTV